MHPLLVVLAVVALIGLIVAIYLFLKRTTGVHGSPNPDFVDCAAGHVRGAMDSGSAEPDAFFARMITSTTDPTTIAKSTWSTWAVAHTTNATGDPITFDLTGVGRDDMSPTIRVAVWCTYGGLDPKSGSFVTTCAGSGVPPMLAGRAAEPAPPRVTDTASMKYSVDLSDFGPELVAGVARACQLIYRGSVAGMLWDNGEDGTERLRVELVADRIYDADWRLTFRFRDIVISYAKSANEWRSLGVNVFHAVVQSSGAQAHFPEAVRLVPA